MQPLRAQVAERIMGEEPTYLEVDAYDGDIAHAMAVVDKLLAKGWEFQLERRLHRAEWTVTFNNRYLLVQAHGATAPQAICLAALETVPPPGCRY